MRLGTIALAFSLSLAACGGPATYEKAPSTAAGGASPAPPEKVGDATLEMLSTGDAPRSELRYSFAAGQRQSMTMDMKMSMSIALGARHPPAVDIPLLRMTITLDPKQVLPSGDLVYGYELASLDLVPEPNAKVPAETAKKLGPALQKLVGLRGEIEVTPRGIVIRSTMDAPPGMDDDVRETIEQTASAMKDLCTPLPSPPVGRGARWRTTSPIRMKGVEATRAVELTLEGRDRDRATLRQEVAITAKPQVIESKRLPAGATLMLESMSAKGRGEVEIDLAKLVPTSHGTVESDAAMTVRAGAEEQAMTIVTRVALDVSPTVK